MADTQITRPTRRVAALSVVVLLAGCGTSAPSGVAVAQGTPIPLHHLRPDNGVVRLWPSAEYVARNEAEWEAAWQQGRRMDPRDEGIPRDGRPVVDFERHMVVGISRGLGSDSSHSLYFIEMIEWPDAIEVRFQYTNPDEDEKKSTQPPGEGVGIPAIAFLSKWALLPRSAKRVRFVRLLG